MYTINDISCGKWQFQKISSNIILPHRRNWKFLGAWVFSKSKTLKGMYQAWGAVGSLGKNPFSGGGMDILWNDTVTGTR